MSAPLVAGVRVRVKPGYSSDTHRRTEHDKCTGRYGTVVKVAPNGEYADVDMGDDEYNLHVDRLATNEADYVRL